MNSRRSKTQPSNDQDSKGVPRSNSIVELPLLSEDCIFKCGEGGGTKTHSGPLSISSSFVHLILLTV